MPDVTLDGTYAVTNINTQQTAQFRPDVIIEYRGFYVLHGVVGQHGIHIYRGIQDIKPRPAAFAFSDQADRGDIMALNAAMQGSPLALVLDADVVNVNGRAAVSVAERRYYPILNATVGLKVLGRYATSDQRIDFARRMVDLYHDWKDAGGVLPAWFLTARTQG